LYILTFTFLTAGERTKGSGRNGKDLRDKD
jgi:hypothetical protein